MQCKGTVLVNYIQIINVSEMSQSLRDRFYEFYDDGEDYLFFLFSEEAEESLEVDKQIVAWLSSLGYDTTKETLIVL